jgi:hypothetical protein
MRMPKEIGFKMGRQGEKVMAHARSNSTIIHVQLQCVTRWSTCTHQLIPFTCTINRPLPLSLFKVHPMEKNILAAFSCKAKSMDVQMPYHISIWFLEKNTASSQSKNVHCCWLGEAKASLSGNFMSLFPTHPDFGNSHTTQLTFRRSPKMSLVSTISAPGTK